MAKLCSGFLQNAPEISHEQYGSSGMKHYYLETSTVIWISVDMQMEFISEKI